MLFHGVVIAVSAISEFLQTNQFDVIKSMVGEVKMNWDRFINVVLYSSPMFSKTFSKGVSSLSNVL